MLKLEFFADEFLFRIPQAFQKCMELIKHPNFRKKFVEPGVYGKPVYFIRLTVVEKLGIFSEN